MVEKNCRLRFPIVAGALLRGQVRNQLNKLKSDIEWEIEGSRVSICETKNFFDSTFNVTVEKISESEARQIERSVKNWINSNN